MLEEVLKHVDDRRRLAWKHALPGAPDLVNMHMAARRLLAEKVERHEISEAEALFEFAKLTVDLEQIGGVTALLRLSTVSPKR
jgi:hypothetical protein